MAEKTVPSARGEATPRGREETRAQERYIIPPVDIFETGDGLTVVADLPGVEEKALDIRVADGILTLQGKTAHVAPGAPLEREYELLHFYRQFELPEEGDVSGLKLSVPDVAVAAASAAVFAGEDFAVLSEPD